MVRWNRTIRHGLWGVVLLASAQAAAQTLPTYDVRSGCQSSSQSIISSPQSASTCLRQEQEAHAQLERTWASFSSADRAECVGESSAGGFPSYADLQTCLQMSKDERAVRRKGRSTTGR
jgi:hypothetical protein